MIPLTLSDETGSLNHQKPNGKSRIIWNNPLSICTIQMGAFTDENNAKGFRRFKTGRAGYVHFDGYYRVLAVDFSQKRMP